MKDIRKLRADWENSLVSQARDEQKERKKSFETESGIEINPLYTPCDLEDIQFDYAQDLGFPGQYPFTRGKNPLGYRQNYWIFNQYAGYGDAEEANKRYRYLLAHGQTGISIALDLPTQIGLDSDNSLASGEVGKVGVAIDSLQDLEIIFKGIELNKLRQISLVINAPAVIGLAMFIALIKKKGVPGKQIVFRMQNDILKEFIARGTFIFPPKPSVRLATDAVTYCANNYPNWLPMTICGYHIRESGANASQEIAFSLANAIEYMDFISSKGYNLENILPKLSAFMSVNMNFFEEICKFRALRRLWARLFKQRYDLKDVSKVNFNLVNFTAGSSLTAQQPMNNIVRVAIECLAGVLGGCQALFPCSMDEAYCTPTENSVKIALRTQQIIAYETGVTDTTDPLGGAYFIEVLTNKLEREAENYLKKIENMGGAIKAIDNGYFQKEIEIAAYKHQKNIENNEKIIVGLNKFIDDDELPIKVFKPPEETEKKQKRKLEELRRTRNNNELKRALKDVEKVARTEDNLVPALVDAVSCYATLGELIEVLRGVFGEYSETDV